MEVRVSVGDTANFTCGAVGSNVDVLWEFEGSIVCDCDSTGCDGAVCSSRTISNFDPMNNNTTIESVLRIDTTSLLINRGQEQEFNCIASQTVPMEVQGSRLDAARFTAILIVESEW